MQCPYCGEENIPGVDICESCGSDLAGLDLPEARGGFRGKLLNDRIGDLRISPALTVPLDTKVAEAIAKMREARHGCVRVVETDGKVGGMLKERHVLTRVVRKELDASATPVSALMSPDPLRLSPEDPPAFAVHCMVAYGFRHMPVVEGDDLLGFISVRNILSYLHRDVIGG
jgi:CBS domain-containing protein